MRSALLGSPVKQSFSPKVYKLIAETNGFNYYSHELYECKNLNDLESKVNALLSDGYLGVNITMPFKVSIIPFLDELDRSAEESQSVNTIKFLGNKKIGYNTDYYGFLTAFKKQLGELSAEDNVVVLGDGGVARGVIYALSKFVKNITVVKRDMSTNKLYPLERLVSISYVEINKDNLIYVLKNNNVFINATSVGMFPNNKDSLLEKGDFSVNEIVSGSKAFDVIFNPSKTKFLDFFENNSVSVGLGYQMLYFQALKSFEIWTGNYLGRNSTELKKIESNLEDWINDTYEK